MNRDRTPDQTPLEQEAQRTGQRFGVALALATAGLVLSVVGYEAYEYVDAHTRDGIHTNIDPMADPHD